MEPMSRRAQRSNEQPAGESARPVRRSRARGRLVKALLLGGVVALAAKPEVRNRLLDALFGPEEQFEYDSLTEPAATPIIPGRGGDEADAAGEDSGNAPESSRPAADDHPSSGGGEDIAAAQDGPLGAGAPDDEPSAPAFEAPTAAATEPPIEPPTVVYEAWSSSAEAIAVPEGEPTVVHESWSGSSEAAAAPAVEPTVVAEHPSWSAEAMAVPEGEPTVVHESWSPSADSAAAPEGEPTVVHEPSSSADEVGAPEGEPTVVFEPWLRSGEDVAAPEGERAVVYEPWTPSEPAAATGEEEPELIVYQEATWLSSPEAAGTADGNAWVEPLEDFEEESPEQSAISTLDPADAASEQSTADEAQSTPEQAEAEAGEQQQQPAIGEAESPRSGWWMPRRRRPDGGTREPPRWD